MHNEYPKYVFKGEYMAMVRSAEERALLPDWADTPPEGFVCPDQAHFHSVDEVLATNLLTTLDQSFKPAEDDDDVEEDDDEEDEKPVEAPVPGVSPRKTYDNAHDRAQDRRLRNEERFAKARAASAAKRAAAKEAQ